MTGLVEGFGKLLSSISNSTTQSAALKNTIAKEYKVTVNRMVQAGWRRLMKTNEDSFPVSPKISSHPVGDPHPELDFQNSRLQ